MNTVKFLAKWKNSCVNAALSAACSGNAHTTLINKSIETNKLTVAVINKTH